MAEGLIKGFKHLPGSGLFAAGSVVTAGAFDGLHLGHQHLIKNVASVAREQQLPAVAITFEPLPREYFSPEDAPARLMSFREKFEGLRELGIDYVLLVRFDDNIRKLPAAEFADQLFVQGLNARHVIIGDDFHFGANAKGDFALLQDILSAKGAIVESIDSQMVSNCRVSSSLIRDKLSRGDFSAAESLLGRPYTIKGKVFPGRQLGRQLGFPTANIQLRRLCTAMSGVYVVDVCIDEVGIFEVCDRWLPAVANVGTRPTVTRGKHVTLEVHLLDYSGDLYGKRLNVRFHEKIRDEKKFDGLDMLKAQIAKDSKLAREYFQLN